MTRVACGTNVSPIATRLSDAPHHASARWAVVCDFDGTAIMGDIADALALRYLGPEQFAHVNAAYQRGEMSFRELLHQLFEPISASPVEIRAVAQQLAEFRPGFKSLLRFAQARGIPVTLASGGLDIYIRPALELLEADLLDGVVLRANHATHRPGGLELQFPYADVPDSCGSCGSCKRAVVRELQRSGFLVVAIGDGNADRCMAGVADVLFARARLLEWCQATAQSCIPFETLDTVVEFLESQRVSAGVQ